MAKYMKIRRDDVCAGCGVALPAGSQAYWLANERVVKCHGGTGLPSTAADNMSAADNVSPAGDASPLDSPDAAADSDVAGKSTQSEYEKRSARELAKKQKRVAEDAEWRTTIKEQRPVLGRIASALTPKPEIGPESQATTAWKVGAEGERRVAEVLAEAQGVEVLHDRRIPSSQANIDHIAIGPSGVFVIDAKKYSGAVEVRDVGSLFRADERLYVNGRDRTKLVDGVLWQVEVVRTALSDEFADVDVHGVLCFIGCEWGLIMRRKCIKGVTALWPRALPDQVSAPGPLDERVAVIAEHLRCQLPPAT